MTRTCHQVRVNCSPLSMTARPALLCRGPFADLYHTIACAILQHVVHLPLPASFLSLHVYPVCASCNLHSAYSQGMLVSMNHRDVSCMPIFGLCLLTRCSFLTRSLSATPVRFYCRSLSHPPVTGQLNLFRHVRFAVLFLFFLLFFFFRFTFLFFDSFMAAPIPSLSRRIYEPSILDVYHPCRVGGGGTVRTGDTTFVFLF